MNGLNFVVIASLITLGSPALAEIFSNQFVQFEKPTGWSCTLEGAEWVCQSKNPRKKKDAIIILAAKLKGEQDSLDKYKAYLGQPKTYKSVRGKPVKSVPKFTKFTTLKGHTWVDSLHLESEIPGFYTRYLATVKQGKIAVLVTYSINEKKYKDMVDQFEAMVKTLAVFYKEGGINKGPEGSLTDIPAPGAVADIVFGGGQTSIAGGGDDSVAPPPKKKSDDDLLFLIVVVGGLLAFIIYKKRQNG